MSAISTTRLIKKIWAKYFPNTEVFSEYGSVKRVHLPIDRETGRKRGFGFVEMETEAAEAKAIETLDGAEWMGREIRVNKARPRDNKNSFKSDSRSESFI